MTSSEALAADADAVAYIRKAVEALEGAERERTAGAYNNTANRPYYAAYRAALAALWIAGVRPARGTTGLLSHQIAQAEWAGQLVYRRKLYPIEMRTTLQELRSLRERADYWRRHVTERQARRAVEQSRKRCRRRAPAPQHLSRRLGSSNEDNTMVNVRATLERRTSANDSPLLDRCREELAALVRAKYPAAEFDWGISPEGDIWVLCAHVPAEDDLDLAARLAERETDFIEQLGVPILTVMVPT